MNAASLGSQEVKMPGIAMESCCLTTRKTWKGRDFLVYSKFRRLESKRIIF